MATDYQLNVIELSAAYQANVTSSTTSRMTDEATFPLVAMVFAGLMAVTILMTIGGNILVILSVFTYKPLRGVQNFYIVSLAVADLAVAILVMPFNVVNSVVGYWLFGAVFCNMWLTFDILMCTASILNLCAIAVDRYYAIHDPINYAQKRTFRRVIVAIVLVWFASGIISIPPLFGWNNRAIGNNTSLYDSINKTCRLTDEPSYVIYSASGSFYLPLAVMAFVYANIYRATKARLRARSSAGLIFMPMKLIPTVAKMASPVETAAAASPAMKKGVDVGLDSRLRRNGDIEVDKEVENVAQTAKVEEQQTGETENKKSSDKSGVGTTPSLGAKAYSLTTSTRPWNHKEPEMTPEDETRLTGLTSLKHNWFKKDKPLHGHLFETRVLLAGTGSNIRCKAAKNEDSPEHLPSSHISQFLEEKQRISLTKERRAARTMAIIMGAFVLCWLPFFLMYVIFPFCTSCVKRTDAKLVNFIVWLGYINSTLNPVIYTIFNIDFRRAFNALLHGKCHS